MSSLNELKKNRIILRFCGVAIIFGYGIVELQGYRATFAAKRLGRGPCFFYSFSNAITIAFLSVIATSLTYFV